MNVQTDRYTDRQTEFTDIMYIWDLLRLTPINYFLIRIELLVSQVIFLKNAISSTYGLSTMAIGRNLYLI